MDMSDLSHSYPFLHLSRKLSVPYERILQLADAFDGKGIANWREPEDNKLVECVSAICVAPWRWQFPPQGRGL